MQDCGRGALIGLAIGDALGAAVEFKAPGSFSPVTHYRTGGPHGLAAGEWTDDTSMALALADSLGCVGWDLHDQARRYVAWWKTGRYSMSGECFDIGIATRSALMHGEDRSMVLSPRWPPLEQLHRTTPLHPLVLEVAQGSFRHKQPPEIQGSGWVVKSLEAALNHVLST